MESLKFDFELNEEQKKYREDCISFCLNDSYVLSFLHEHNLNYDFVKEHSSKLKEWALCKRTCANCKSLNDCQYHQGKYFELRLLDGLLTHVYAKCRYLKDKEEKNEYLNHYVIFHGDESMKLRDFKQVDKNNKDSKDVIEICNALIKSVSEPKGIYLYGKPGIGKTFYMNCLGHYYVKKKMSVAFVNSATLMSDLKNNFGIVGYSEEVLTKLKTCDILILDDIGGESISPWSRDEILMPLLNERMEKMKKTYFTSNYDFNELEEHFSIDSKGHIDKIKANRLMERIKAVSQEKSLKGINRRL
ncbi:MAG: ATP-binding protein [Traorella sp.]